MKASLPMTAALSALAKQQGVDLSKLAAAEIDFERKYAALEQWLKSRRQA